MTLIRISTAAILTCLAFAASAEAPLVKYSYSGPTMTVIEGDEPPWTEKSFMTGYFVVAELPPSTTIDFLDPDLEFPYPNLPKEFSFSDGARTITQDNMEPGMKDTRLRNRPSMHEVRTFWIQTDGNGQIKAWDVLFVSHVLENTFLSTFDGDEHGQDQTEVQTGDFGCTAAVECRANVNVTREGPKFRGTVYPGEWSKEVLN